MAAKVAARAVAALALAAVPAAGREYYPDLHLSGACDAKQYLNGLRFHFEGFTAAGSPWYKATARSEYLYWDPDCGGGGDGQARWTLTDKVPNPKALRDLDGDNLCNYDARVNNPVHSYPPNTDFWYMDCGGVVRKLLIVLGEITMTSTSTTQTTTSVTTTSATTTRTTTSTTGTTTTRTATSTVTSTRTTTSSTKTTTTRTTTSRTATTRTNTGTTTTDTSTARTETTTQTGTTTSRTTTSRTTTIRSTTTTTTTLMVLRLIGACPFKYFLDGLTFVEEGNSASGARYFKALEAEQYIYYDWDCNGGGDGARRWIVDNSMPYPAFKEDLDQDGKCNYHARLDSGYDMDGPPPVATWQMWCGLGWTDAVLHLDNTSYTFDDGLDVSTELKVRGLFDQCLEKAFLDNMVFHFQGHTASGAPYYKSAEMDQYIYYDPHCSGNVLGSSKWIIDADKPDLNAPSDLDGDFNCGYHARVKSKNTAMPPKGAIWRMECGGEWKDMWLALIRLPTTTTTTSTRPPATTTAMRRAVLSNGAAGDTPLLAVLFVICLVHLRVRL